MDTSLPYLDQIILYSEPVYIERLSPFICACPLLPCSVCLQPCEKENHYILLYCDENWGKWGQIVYEIKEKSNFWQRCFCPPSRRPLDLEGSCYDGVHIKANKPLKCSFFCLSRPEISVHYREQYIGKIKENFQYSLFKCSFYQLECYDKNNALIYTISASLCQCSLFCVLSCDPCKEIVYYIKNRKNEKIGKLVSKNIIIEGQISHIFGGCQREWCTKSDVFGVKFPSNSTVEEKIILILATIFVDYAQFENY